MYLDNFYGRFVNRSVKLNVRAIISIKKLPFIAGLWIEMTLYLFD